MTGALTIATAASLRDLLIEKLAAAERLTLDLSAVMAADLTLPQLILAAQRDAAAAGRRVDLLAPSAAVRRAFDGAGLGRCLDSAGEDAT